MCEVGGLFRWLTQRVFESGEMFPFALRESMRARESYEHGMLHTPRYVKSHQPNALWSELELVPTDMEPRKLLTL